MSRANAMRRRIPFRSVNRHGDPGYDPELQRHHLLPLQLLSEDCFGTMFEAVGLEAGRFDDFRANGLLLPASEEAALRTGMPLHRGPHRIYNEMVIARVGRIEQDWSGQRLENPEAALRQALMRLGLLQGALRRRLMDQLRKRLLLNRKDPLRTQVDFSDLDAMAETLWGATGD